VSESRQRTITKIEAQSRNKRRVSVFLDGEFAFGLDRSIALKYDLKEGKFLSQEEIDHVLLEEERRKAKEQAFRWLAVRDRSVKEIKDKFREKGYDPSIVQWVIQELKRLHLLDDRAFAEAYVRNRLIHRPCGAYVLKEELKQKGISDEIIAAAVEEGYEETPPLELARQLVRKRWNRYRSLESEKARRRLTDFLRRRGFDWETITEALRLEGVASGWVED